MPCKPLTRLAIKLISINETYITFVIGNFHIKLKFEITCVFNKQWQIQAIKRREENNLTTKGKGVPQNKVDERQFDVQEKIFVNETICKACKRWWSSISWFGQIWLLKNMKCKNLNILIAKRQKSLNLWGKICNSVKLLMEKQKKSACKKLTCKKMKHHN
jgi:hypothetical protein